MASNGTSNTDTSNLDSGTGKATTGVSGQAQKRSHLAQPFEALHFLRPSKALQFVYNGGEYSGKLTCVGLLSQVEEQQPTTIRGLLPAEPLKEQLGSVSICMLQYLVHNLCAVRLSA